jgi:hypothetical protein
MGYEHNDDNYLTLPNCKLLRDFGENIPRIASEWGCR